jgi:hypothetical protein
MRISIVEQTLKLLPEWHLPFNFAEVGPAVQRPISRLALFRFIAVAAGMAFALLVVELGFRISDGALSEVRNLRHSPWGFRADGFVEYDSLVGWVPRPNAGGVRSGGWSAHVDDQRLRLNGTLTDSTNWTTPSILAVGDSAAFGDEVDDGDTWPAQLEQRLQRRVLNAGMSAYGIDQAVLRAERLVPRFDSSIVVLSVV